MGEQWTKELWSLRNAAKLMNLIVLPHIALSNHDATARQGRSASPNREPRNIDTEQAKAEQRE